MSIGTGATVADGDRSFFEGVRAQLDSSWRRPVVMVSANKPMKSQVSFRLRRDGSVSNVYLVEKSGNTHLDNSVLTAVRRVRRFPQLPESVGTNNGVTIVATFEMRK